MRRFLPGRFGSGRAITLIVAGIEVLWLFSGFYRIQPDKQGVELLFVKWDSEPAGARSRLIQINGRGRNMA